MVVFLLQRVARASQPAGDLPRCLRYPRSAAMRVYQVTVGDGRSTEELVAAGHYGYAHSCVSSEHFPIGRFPGKRTRDVVLVELDLVATAAEAITHAEAGGLKRPSYEGAPHFGCASPLVQAEHPVISLHDPWFGFFGRRDVICLWSNAGRRELGLEGFDSSWSPAYRFAFIRRA